ncbi:Pentatricopeptide repeat-containing protein [Musa troglodytarum]|uniref:Pentatricopeptide repeat-containing protein n=1 Tax=Musa troglodytarum TaxID=320322 RepID=A0A9E7KH57_9LILI|nr:Pentatricopeptide repeat-containing protein [Musa troglodytarum]
MRALPVRLPSFCSTLRDSLFAASPRPFHASSTSSPRLPKTPCFQSLSFLLQYLSKTPNDPKSVAALDSALAEAHLLDSTASVLVIRALSRCKKLTRAKSVLSGLKRRGTVPDLFLYSLVLQCLLPESSIRDVESVWHDIKGGGPDGISGASDFVIGLCRRRVDTSEIEQVYHRVSRSRWSLSRQSFCRVGNVFEADLVLRSMVDRWNCELDILIYGNFLYGLCKSGKLREARKLFDKLLKKGQNIKDSLIPVLKPGRRVIFQLSSTKLISKTVAFGAYFQSLCKTGRVEEAEMLLKEATEKNIPVETCVYVSFIEALCRAGRAEDAVEFLDLEKKKQSVSVGDITVAVIAGLCKLGQVDDGYRLLLEMVNEGVSPTAQVCNWILKSYWKAGRMEEAIGLFEKLRAGNCGGCVGPNASTYSLMIHGFLGRGDIVMAVSFIEQMEREKLQVDVGLHTSVVRSLYTTGKLEETQHYMNKMIESGSIVSYAEWEEFVNSMTMTIEDIYTLKSVTEMRGH